MYQGQQQATADDMRALGLPPSAAGNFEAPATVVWECHWPALELFAAMSTQWRVGMAGPTGLDYSSVPAVFDIYGVAQESRRERMDELRVMEREALALMGERRR